MSSPVRIISTGLGAVLMAVNLCAWAALPVEGRMVSVAGTESISEPYRFEVEIIGRLKAKSLAAVIGEAASFRLPGGRTVAGIVREVRNLGVTPRGHHFAVVIGPRLADLEQVRRSRTFSEATSVQIAQQVLDEPGVDAQFNLADTVPMMPHSTQFEESDLAYLHRLLEAQGQFYYFQHTAAGAGLVVTDRVASTPMVPAPLQGSGSGRGRTLLSLDYGFNRDPTAGAVARGESTLSALSAGHRVRVAGHSFGEANQTYLITRVDHVVSEDGNYRNAFAAVPASSPFAPPTPSPLPRLASAFGQVTGPAGEEIHVDEYGRVQVALPWTASGTAAPWMRVLQPNGDSLWLPRVGEEVLVAFEFGDPDRPYVVGTAFNAQHPPPFALPQLKAVRRLGSRSSPGGDGVNEVFFGDVAGQQLLRLGAAKDLRTIALNDHHSAVGNDLTTRVDADARLTVGGDQQITVGGHSRTQAGELVLEGTNRIVLRVGAQQLVIDASGVHLPQPQPATTTEAPPRRTAPGRATPELLKRTVN